MLGIFVITGCVLITCAVPPTNGYSLGTLSGGRGQEYSSGYTTGGFIGIKDSYSDSSDHSNGGDHSTTADTQRYSVISAGPNKPTFGSGYASEDSGHSDSSLANSHTSSFGDHSSSTDALASISSSSYSPSDLGGAGHSSSGSPSGNLGGFSTSGAGSGGNPAGSGFVRYSEAFREHGVSSQGLSNSDATEYSTSHPTGSYVPYTVGGPKASAYTSSNGGHGNHGHQMNSHSLNPSANFMTSSHHAEPSSSSYSFGSSRPGISSGPNSSSGPAFNNFLASMHITNGPSRNYIPHGNGGGHRAPSHHLFAAASNPSTSYTSRGPGSGYFANSPYPRGGGKIVLVKENKGAHAGHIYPGHPGGEQYSYGGTSGGYKIRNVSPGSSYGTASFAGAGGYSTSGSYNSGHSHASNNRGSFLGFLGGSM